jgi:hypothetical protein
MASPLVLRSSTGTMISSASQATVETPLQTHWLVPPYTPQPRRSSLTPLRLVGIGTGAIILLLVLVLLLPNLLNNESDNQGHTAAQTATTTAPSPTSTTAPSPTATTADNACDNQPQVTINDTTDVLDVTQICHAVSTWPYTLTIYTTTLSSQDDNLSDKANALLTDANTVVMAIGIDRSDDHQEPQISIIGGDSVQISDTHYQHAKDVFTSPANAGEYTDATIAAIEALQAPEQKQKQHGKGKS